MKIFALALLVLVACTRPAPRSPNLATAFVHSVDTDITCTDYFTDAGEHHAHAALCKLPGKHVVYCTVSADTWPQCKPIDGSDDKPPAKPPTPPPAAPPPPVEPPHAAAPISPPAPTPPPGKKKP